MACENYKNVFLRGMFIGLMANSIIIWGWLPAFFQLNPGEGYRNVAGLVAVIVAIPAPFVYGIILMFKKTKHRFLKVMSVILNLAPLGVLVLLVVLLSIMGHYPAE